MLALWHLASGTPLGDYPQDVQDLLAGDGFDELGGVRRVALVGQPHLAVGLGQGRRHTQVNTIWGELAWQLGGKEAFARLRPPTPTAPRPGRRCTTC